MILAQLAEGRCEVENQYKRVVPYEGNLAALKVMSEVFELRPHFEWRGLGFISQSALRLSEAYADLDAELRYEVPGVRVADPKACQCGEVLKGVIKPWECKVFGTACTPEHAIGDLHGLAGGRLRRLLQLRPLRARAGGGVADVAGRRRRERSRAADPRDHRDRPREAAAVQGRADHDGPRRRRQGDADPDRGAARARASARRRWRRLGDAGAVTVERTRARDDHRQLRRAGRSASPAARSASWRSTAPSTTSRWPGPAAGAQPGS